MSGLSPATVQRLAALEAQPELASKERGELRSMTHCRPSADERLRVDRLLSRPVPTDPDAPSAAENYARGMDRSKSPRLHDMRK